MPVPIPKPIPLEPPPALILPPTLQAHKESTKAHKNSFFISKFLKIKLLWQ